MRILHLSTSDIGGGAARAAHRLHTGLLRMGIDSRMLVLKRNSLAPEIAKVKFYNDLPTRFRRSRRRTQIEKDFAPYKNNLPSDFELYSDDRSETAFDLNRQLPEVDLINLHWVAGLIDHEQFFGNLPPNVPLVWRLADMAALTGGCHYDGGCGKYTAKCGACPILNSKTEDDLSRAVWTRKHAALANISNDRMNLVGTSRWIAGEAKRSSLLGRFPIHVIPNGLDVNDFAPRDKGFARDTLGIPRNAKVVLFVADTAALKRKGFDYVAAALAKLSGEPDLFLLSVGGGKPNVPGIPQLHVGKISHDRYLSIIYSAADAFVMPSLQESFGQTITESMACGTPVVGFNTGGPPDMIRPGITGYLAPVADADGLRDGILKVIRNPQDAAAMSVNCRRIAMEEYSMPVQAAAYAKLYQTILNPKSVERSASVSNAA